MGDKRKISLVLADVDGTLVTEQKVLTKRAQAAVQHLREAGIRSHHQRPAARGMACLLDDLRLDTPIAGFNGGVFVTRSSPSSSRRRCQTISRQGNRADRACGSMPGLSRQ